MLSLEKLLEKYQGKPIYLDFWASWCAPCIAAMPDSKILDKKLNGDVHFIYISTDTDENKWKESALSFDLNPKYIFIALNFEESKFLKEFEVYEIPRYLLFDKNGKLTDDRATSPDDYHLESVLKKMIN